MKIRANFRNERNGNCKLSNMEIEIIRWLYDQGFTKAWLATECNISKTHVGRIVRREARVW